MKLQPWPENSCVVGEKDFKPKQKKREGKEKKEKGKEKKEKGKKKGEKEGNRKKEGKRWFLAQ